MVTADDVARVVAWLASDGSSFVNGQDLVVDCGISAGRPLSVSNVRSAGATASARRTRARCAA
jgi:hypothetical protein